MMVDRSTANPYGATPGRLALIGVLAVVLVSAVYWNILREQPSQTVPKSAKDHVASKDSSIRAGAPAIRRGTARAKPATNPQVRIRTKSWPEVELANVVAYDPFAVPETFPQPEAIAPEEQHAAVSRDANQRELAVKRQAAIAAQAAAIESIRSKGVQAILRSDDNFIAIVNGREIRIGDVIEGFTVVHISTEGIRLQGRNE
ncbi:MAG: hypothetical protein JW829_08550 [Pirellulales bacterium]|nr:hypothetical protein [Pirellulales bacterium]